LSANFGEEEFFTGGLSIRATMNPDLQVEAGHALQRALEGFDRAQGEWHGTWAQLPREALADEAAWRAALAETDAPRDIRWTGGGIRPWCWRPAKRRCGSGIEGAHARPRWVPRDDIDWIPGSSPTTCAGRRGAGAQAYREDGRLQRWTLRQVPEVQGAFMAMDVNTGACSPCRGASATSLGLQPRYAGARQPARPSSPSSMRRRSTRGTRLRPIVVDAPIEIDTPEGLWTPQNASGEYYGPRRCARASRCRATS
jgi:penicillin-binding protein 1A